jgi:hypothetical protein
MNVFKGSEKHMEDKRKVLLTYGMSNDCILILTNATKQAIEKWCYNYNEEMENGKNTYLDSLQKDYYVEILLDSEEDIIDIKDVEYDEVYDRANYIKE